MTDVDLVVRLMAEIMEVPPEKIDPKRPFSELFTATGADSLRQLELMSEIERTYQILLPEDLSVIERLTPHQLVYNIDNGNYR